MKRSQRTASSDFENRARILASSPEGSSIKLAVACLDQAGVRQTSISTQSLRTETVNRGECSALRKLEDGADVGGSTVLGCPVEIAVSALHQDVSRNGAVRRVECNGSLKGLCRRYVHCDAEHRNQTQDSCRTDFFHLANRR